MILNPKYSFRGCANIGHSFSGLQICRESSSSKATFCAFFSLPSSPHLEDRVGEQEPVPDSLELLRGGTSDCIVLQDLLGCLCLASPTLPRDEDEVVVVLIAHHPVGVVSYGIAGMGTGGIWRGNIR